MRAQGHDICENGVEMSIKEFGSNSMNKEGSEGNIAEGDEEVNGKENFEQNKQNYNQGNARKNDDAMYGHGVRWTNSNIVGRHYFEWRGVECDLVKNGGVFIAKGRVVTCDPYEIIIDDWLKEAHVRLCILYSPTIVLAMMTIWK